MSRRLKRNQLNILQKLYDLLLTGVDPRKLIDPSILLNSEDIGLEEYKADLVALAQLGLIKQELFSGGGQVVQISARGIERLQNEGIQTFLDEISVNEILEWLIENSNPDTRLVSIHNSSIPFPFPEDFIHSIMFYLTENGFIELLSVQQNWPPSQFQVGRRAWEYLDRYSDEIITTFNIEHFQGKILIRTYRLEKFLAEGGSGRVFLATLVRNTHFASKNEKIVIKAYHTHILKNPEQIKRIEREGMNVFSREAVQDCRNIAKVFAVEYLSEGEPFLVMEYVEGQSALNEIRLRDGELFPPEEILRRTKEICEALLVLHNEDLIHRDIKPENIMVRQGRMVLLDFGIVKDLQEDTITPTSQFLGSWYYAPPEMFKGEELDVRTDLYLLGGTLYHMIKLVKPHVNVPKPLIPSAPQLSLMENDCADAFLRNLVNRLLMHDRNERPRSVSNIIRAIEAYEEYKRDPSHQEVFENSLDQLAFSRAEIAFIFPEDQDKAAIESSYEIALQKYGQEQIINILRNTREKHDINCLSSKNIVDLVQRPGIAESIDPTFPYPIPIETIKEVLNLMVQKKLLFKKDDSFDFSHL